MTEQELVLKFKEAKQNLDAANLAADEAQKEFDYVEFQTLEYLDDFNKKNTGKITGIGHVTAFKPRLSSVYYPKELEGELFDWLKENELEPLIKQTVNNRSLTSAITEKIQSGELIPEYIGLRLKETARFYPEKK